MGQDIRRRRRKRKTADFHPGMFVAAENCNRDRSTVGQTDAVGVFHGLQRRFVSSWGRNLGTKRGTQYKSEECNFNIFPCNRDLTKQNKVFRVVHLKQYFFVQFYHGSSPSLWKEIQSLRQKSSPKNQNITNKHPLIWDHLPEDEQVCLSWNNLALKQHPLVNQWMLDLEKWKLSAENKKTTFYLLTRDLLEWGKSSAGTSLLSKLRPASQHF